MNRTHIALCLALAAASAAADISSVTEFTGDFTETFEGIIAPGPHAGPMPIFGGQATMDDQLTDAWISNILSGGGGESLVAYDGNLMGLAPTGWTEFVFSTPATQFGGFFGTGSASSGGSATFYDANGGIIDTVAFHTTEWEWTWHGWHSDEAFSKVVIHANVNPGVVGVYDNFQVNLVPAPAGLAAFIGAGVMLTRRRR